ncbi:AI-2E family transporter [Peribacillus sp. SI8-4]|uniref:AI-2E family transporter n=1 Tax=Peribacillus sp. SI8-4 TaxID=3048009 RepID=UPI0025552BDC|nr:AI-2E family transporter [Peribacillus sp. SI8-4]
MGIRVKWFYRLGFLLLLFFVIYIFMKLKPLWGPIVTVCVTVLIPFLIGAFISYLLHPVVEYLKGKGMRRWLSITIIYLLFFGGIGFAVYKGIPVMVSQVRELSESVPELVEQYRSRIDNLNHQTAAWPFGIHERVEEGILLFEGWLKRMPEKAMEYAVKLIDFIVLIALIPFIAFYILKDFTALKKMAWYMTPKKWRKQGRDFVRDVDASLGSYIRGQIIVCAVIGLLSSLLFWIVGMDYPLLLGAIIGVTNVIPYFGPIIGAIPAVILAATISVKMVVIIAIIVVVLQFLEGNVLSPLIVGKSLHMHPLFIMLALLAGGEIGGITGMVLSIPILAVLKVFVLHARVHFRKKPPLIDK